MGATAAVSARGNGGVGVAAPVSARVFAALALFISLSRADHLHPPLHSSQWVAPIAGAICATYVYELGFRPDYDPFISLESGGGAAGGAATSAAAGGKASAYPTA